MANGTDVTVSPPAPLHRVVTGHTDGGVAVVRSEDKINMKEDTTFGGVRGASIWVTETTPTDDNNLDIDGVKRSPDGDCGIVQHNGTVCRCTDLAPGASASMHRTTSFDYNILIEGKLVLIMEDGSETLVDTPGSVIIQRGTLHAWWNPGPSWTRWVSVLVDANSAVVGGKALTAEVW